MSLVIGVFFYSTPLNRRDGFRNSIDERATDPRNAVASRYGWWFLRVAADEKKFQHTRLVSEFAIASADVIAKVPHSTRWISEASVAARAPRDCVNN